MTRSEVRCVLCGQLIEGEPVARGSDGEPVHEDCELEYEDVVYLRELEGDG